MLQVVVKTALVVATLAALYLLFILRDLVLTVFVAIIFASALRPVVHWMERRLRLSQSASALVLYGLATVAVVAGTAAVVPSLVGDARALMARSAEIYQHWYDLATSLRAGAGLGVMLPQLPPQPQVRAAIDAATAAFQRALPQYALRMGGILADVLLGMLMAYYWLEARDELLAAGPQFLPATHRARFLVVAPQIERALGAYIGGQLLLSLLIGVASLLAFVLIGLPDPVVLAFIGALLHVIPLAGALVGAIPAILVAGAVSPAKGIVTAVALLVIHQLENSFIAPRLLQRQVGLSPLLVIIALTAGAILDGVVGALIAVPAAGALCIVARSLLADRSSATEGPGSDQLAAPDEAPAGQGLEP